MPSANASILAVDDDRIHAYAIARKLRAHGFRVKAVYSGVDAITEIRSGHYDAVLLDINMPGLDGYRTCKCIRSEHNIAQPAIVFHSASESSEPAMYRAYDAGGDAFLSYPVDDEQLTAVLLHSVALRRSRAFAESTEWHETLSAGDIVLASGSYEVRHGTGCPLPTGSVVLFVGAQLPRCPGCPVTYRLLQPLPHFSEDFDLQN